MAFSKITINHANIASHFQAGPLRGTGVSTGRGGVGRGEAKALADRIALRARINAAERFYQRTGDLVSSVVPIVRTGPDGQVEVGVGTTMKPGAAQEVRAPPHLITPERPFRGRGRGGYFLRSNGKNSKGGNPTPLDRPRLFVNHPGVPEPTHWMSDAVRSVIPGARVNVRVLRDLSGSDGRR